jgi:hypothetical protein
MVKIFQLNGFQPVFITLATTSVTSSSGFILKSPSIPLYQRGIEGDLSKWGSYFNRVPNFG